jgi:hypothetical protein
MKNFVNDKDKAVITYDIDFKTNNYCKNAGAALFSELFLFSLIMFINQTRA